MFGGLINSFSELFYGAPSLGLACSLLLIIAFILLFK